MSEKTRLQPREAEPHHQAPHKYLIERGDNCINCGTCATACVYDCHMRSEQDLRKMADPKPDCCRNCFACVLRCPREALKMILNPKWELLGDDEVYTPGTIISIQDQAGQGKIPVTGAGYGGPFDGEGFDNIWTDMSEIVRPTRDGIHGREHISTTVNLGRKIFDICGLDFDALDRLKSHIPPSREIPIPILFGLSPLPTKPQVNTALALAASKLDTFLTIRAQDLDKADGDPTPLEEDFISKSRPLRLIDFFNHLVIRMQPAELENYKVPLAWASLVELEPGPGQIEAVRLARSINPQVITILRVPARFDVPDRIVELVQAGAEIIHLSADRYGRGEQGAPLIHCLRETHQALIDEGLRDLVTLVASGGIAAAEHVPKTVLLGADAVMVDMPLLIALECTVCKDCEAGKLCTNNVGVVDPSWKLRGEDPNTYTKWGATRVINLMVSWRDQLLEVLGAMGIRDVRRLRGETGRAIFGDVAKTEFLKRIGQGSESKTIRLTNSEKKSIEEDFANRDLLVSKNGAAHRRFPTLPGDWHVRLDRDLCTDCGICVDSCRYGVHRRKDGKAFVAEPIHGKCIGPVCSTNNDWCCVDVCPWNAISLDRSTLDDVLGDLRWTSTLLKETYRQARTGHPQKDAFTEMTGASGGGFDQLRLSAYVASSSVSEDNVDLSIPLNRRATPADEVRIPIPVYGGGMSYGSISLEVMLGRAKAAGQLGTFISTGEGGYPDELLPYKDHVITQIATGLFGVREETILRARLIEFKYAQGAKPGLGGHLLGEKNTPDVALMREAVEGTGLFSPFPFHSVYSVEDHKKHLDWIRSIHPDVLISVKVSTPADVDMVAVGSYYAGANIVNIDGAYGGTGAAPDIAKKNIAVPIEYAIAQVHDFLVAEGIREKVTLISGGGIRSADDVLKAIALGADGVSIGTAELVAIDCVRCGNCERGRGCPLGIATTDKELAGQLDSDWVCRRIVNMYNAWAAHIRRRLAALNLDSIGSLCGRRDLLRYIGAKR